LEAKSKWRWGVNRWILLACIILGIIGAYYFPPVQPHIQVAPENLTHDPLFTLPVIGSFYLTNTMLAILIANIIVILLGWKIKKDYEKSGVGAPKGITGVIEMLAEYLWNMTESNAGKWTASIFPYFMTIVLVVLVANWMEMIPGVDSIGKLEEMAGGASLMTLIPGALATIVPAAKGAASEAGYVVTPFIRAAATDLNFTAALAIISVFMTQVIGFRAQGIDYFSKFFNVKTLWTKPFFGAMDFLVGLLELISELSKILSFTFRLFGNVFAGSVLLFLVSSMLPVFMPAFIVLFEVFIGLIQAAVFGMLTMIFMSMATQGHGGHEEEHA
jgi:F-type H+-transporting ATPase subunit a